MRLHAIMAQPTAAEQVMQVVVYAVHCSHCKSQRANRVVVAVYFLQYSLANKQNQIYISYGSFFLFGRNVSFCLVSLQVHTNNVDFNDDTVSIELTTKRLATAFNGHNPKSTVQENV